MSSDNRNAPLNRSADRGLLSQLGSPGRSAAHGRANGSSNNNLALEIAEGEGISPSLLAPRGAHSSTKEILASVAERKRSESFSLPRFAGAGAGAEEDEDEEADEPDIFDEFEDKDDLNDEYAQEIFENDILQTAPQEVFDDLLYALETIEEEDESKNDDGNDLNKEDVSRIFEAIRNTKEQFNELEKERSVVKSSASSKNSVRSTESVKRTSTAIGQLAQAILDVGTTGSEAAEAAEDSAKAGNKRKSNRERKEPERYKPEYIRRVIRRSNKKPRLGGAGAGSQALSSLSQVSNLSTITSTLAFLMAMKGSRIEGPSPDSQLKFIHGQAVFDSVNGDTKCDLCGFALKDRQPDAYYEEGNAKNILKWSYDHTIPVNYVAAVLKIYLTGAEYSAQELEIMSYLGGPTCYHCNLIKSQQKFITCPDSKRYKWARLNANVGNIDTFLAKLYASTLRGSNAIDNAGNTSLVRLVNEIKPQKGKNSLAIWKEDRQKFIKAKAIKICELIKTHVNYDNAYARVKLMRSVIKAERAKLQKEGRTSAEIKRQVSRVARGVLFKCPIQPWNDTVALRPIVAGGNYPFYIPPDIVRPVPKKSRKRKQMRKRTRKNLRSK